MQRQKCGYIEIRVEKDSTALESFDVLSYS
jgi:hypothetical protein